MKLFEFCKAVTRGTVFIVALGATAFWSGNAYAQSCFTDIPVGFWAEEDICWMKSEDITTGYADGTYRPSENVSRSQMARFLHTASEIPPTTGDVYISTGPSNWVANGAYIPAAYVTPYWAYTHLKASSIGTYLYSISPSLPSSLYNTKMYVKGAKLCYDASATGAYISAIEIKHITYSSNGYEEWNYIYDDTDLTDVGCKVIYFGSPSSFWGNDQVTVNVYATFTSTTNPVRVGVATVILKPSTENAVLSIDASERLIPEQPKTIDPASGR